MSSEFRSVNVQLDIEHENKVRIKQFEKNEYKKIKDPVFIIEHMDQIKIFSTYNLAMAYEIREIINECVLGIDCYMSIDQLHKDVDTIMNKGFSSICGVATHLDMTKPIYKIPYEGQCGPIQSFLTNDSSKRNAKLIVLDPELSEITFE